LLTSVLYSMPAMGYPSDAQVLEHVLGVIDVEDAAK
jgi:hypothetical protein